MWLQACIRYLTLRNTTLTHNVQLSCRSPVGEIQPISEMGSSFSFTARGWQVSRSRLSAALLEKPNRKSPSSYGSTSDLVVRSRQIGGFGHIKSQNLKRSSGWHSRQVLQGR